MHLNKLGTSIYRGTPRWSNMNRLEIYMNGKNKKMKETITLSSVALALKEGLTSERICIAALARA